MPEPNFTTMELYEAKEILAEVFCICSEEVEEMIRRRLKERSRAKESLWPERFCL